MTYWLFDVESWVLACFVTAIYWNKDWLIVINGKKRSFFLLFIFYYIRLWWNNITVVTNISIKNYFIEAT